MRRRRAGLVPAVLAADLLLFVAAAATALTGAGLDSSGPPPPRGGLAASSSPAPVPTTAPPTTTTTAPPPPPRLWFTSQPTHKSSPVLHSIGPGGDERVEAGPGARADQVSPDGAFVVLDETNSSTYEGCGFAGCSRNTTSTGSIVIKRADGSEPRTVAQGGFDRAPRWAPAGDVIAYVSHRKRPDDTEFDGIAFMRPSGEELGIIPNPRGGVGAPTFSPDGSKVAYLHVQSNPKGSGNLYELRVFDLGSGAEQVIARERLESPMWSPDGTRLAAVRQGESPTDPASLVVLPADGAGPVRVLHTVKSPMSKVSPYYCGVSVNEFPTLVYPMWSPDSAAIAFESNSAHISKDGTTLDIFSIGADGTGLRVVRKANPPPHCAPDVHRDADRLVLLGWR